MFLGAGHNGHGYLVQVRERSRPRSPLAHLRPSQSSRHGDHGGTWKGTCSLVCLPPTLPPVHGHAKLGRPWATGPPSRPRRVRGGARRQSHRCPCLRSPRQRHREPAEPAPEPAGLRPEGLGAARLPQGPGPGAPAAQPGPQAQQVSCCPWGRTHRSHGTAPSPAPPVSLKRRVPHPFPPSAPFAL